MSSLLPKHHEEFRSKEYWDNFFQERGQEAFEWYGSYQDVEFYLQKYLKLSDRFLIIGCGNSNFSADFYDQGFRNIVNIDFSELVIEEMRTKNVTRDHMIWDVGDMTSMNQYSDNSFDIVIDKGALDALMSVNTLEIKQKAMNMFNEISRVLQVNGKYICITLAEEYILDTILEYFIEDVDISSSLSLSPSLPPTKWCLSIELVKTKSPSPYKPFFLLLSKVKSITSPLAGIIRLTIDNLGNPLLKPKTVSHSILKETIESIQGFSQKEYNLSILRPGRFESIEIYSNHNNNNSNSNTESMDISHIPRYTLLIVDIDSTMLVSTIRGECAVFFIPQGREHEYQFSSKEGLSNLAKKASYSRLISVRTHRPHKYHQMTSSSSSLSSSQRMNSENNSKSKNSSLINDMQSELSPIIISLAPRDCDPNSIPFMSIEADSSWDMIHTGISTLSGEYIIEESDISTDNTATTSTIKGKQVIRRLIFLQNQNFIQTEVRLCENNNSIKSSLSVRKSKSKNKSKKIGTKDSNSNSDGPATMNDDTNIEDDKYVFDYSYMDAHHIATLISFVIQTNTTIISECKSYRSIPPRKGLVIGLGGGAFAMLLQKYLPGMAFTICDIDEILPTIATKYFGFRVLNENCIVKIQEGMSVIDEYVDKLYHRVETIDDPMKTSLVLNTQNMSIDNQKTQQSIVTSNSFIEKLSFLYIDADSKDTSIGLSAPPLAFITKESVQKYYDILEPDGILVMNVVARNQSLLEELITIVKNVFNGIENITKNTTQSSIFTLIGPGRVFTLRPSEDIVNTALIALKGSQLSNSSDSTSSIHITTTATTASISMKSKKSDMTKPAKEMYVWENTLDLWLKHVGFASDPLKSKELLALLKEQK